MATDEQTVITAQAAAELLSISVQTLYKHAAAGRVPAKRLGGRWIFVREQLAEWLADTGESAGS